MIVTFHAASVQRDFNAAAYLVGHLASSNTDSTNACFTGSYPVTDASGNVQCLCNDISQLYNAQVGCSACPNSQLVSLLLILSGSNVDFFLCRRVP